MLITFRERGNHILGIIWHHPPLPIANMEQHRRFGELLNVATLTLWDLALHTFWHFDCFLFGSGNARELCCCT